MLLREFNALCPNGICDISLLTEAERKMQQDGRIILTGILQRANTKNGNRRIYSRKILEREDNNYQKLIRENRALGECDHPDTEIVELQNASHRILRTFWKGDELWGIIQLLTTPKGKILEALVSDGVQLGISSRGLGSVQEANTGDIIVQEDFQLVAYDMVSDPSTPGAFMLKEAKMPLRQAFTKADRIYRLLNNILER